MQSARQWPVLGAQDKEGGDGGRDKDTHRPASTGDSGHKRQYWKQVFVLGSPWVRRVDGRTDGWRCVSDRQIEKGGGYCLIRPGPDHHTPLLHPAVRLDWAKCRPAALRGA